LLLGSFSQLSGGNNGSVCLGNPVHDGSNARARIPPVDLLLEEASVFLQVREESTNLFDSYFVNFREFKAQQLIGELPKCFALILLEPQIIPSIILRCEWLQNISVPHGRQSLSENERWGWRVAHLLLALLPATSSRIGNVGVGVIRRSEWARLLVRFCFRKGRRIRGLASGVGARPVVVDLLRGLIIPKFLI
jgi:hypothetical protein